MSDINLKPRKELEQAIRKINKEFTFDQVNGHLLLSSDSRAYKLVKFIQENFGPDEVLNRSIGLDFDDEICDHYIDMLKENLSVLLISNKTEEIIACNVITTSKKGESYNWTELSNRKFADIMVFLEHRYAEMDIFQYFDVEEALGFDLLVTDRNYRGQGIASKMVDASLHFCKILNLNPCCIKVEATSYYSQKIYEKFGFESIHTMRYDEYKPEGDIVFKNTGIHDSTKCYVKRL